MKNKSYIAKYNKNKVFLIISNLVIGLFHIVRPFFNCKCINYPKEKCIFALWHAHQCAVFACNQERKTVIMVSNSKDGEIISRAANAMNVETIRGSQSNGGAKASFQLIKAVKENDVNGAITIDGPKGPNRVVKKGIIDIARMAGVPIVPAVYWSPDITFLKFNSWDNFRFPFIGSKVVMSFANSIDVPENPTSEQVEEIRLKVENSLNELYEDIKLNYKKYRKIGKKVKNF